MIPLESTLNIYLRLFRKLSNSMLKIQFKFHWALLVKRVSCSFNDFLCGSAFENNFLQFLVVWKRHFCLKAFGNIKFIGIF